MNAINTKKWSTPVTIGAGLFVTISGTMMFFGVHRPIELAHEWIGLLFAVAILFHILNHWNSFQKYFSQRMALGLVGVIVLVTGSLIAVSATKEGGDVKMAMIHSFEGSPLTEVAPLLDVSAESIVSRFEAAGFEVRGTEQTIEKIAAVNGTEPRRLMGVLFGH
ncbi:MAG: DUF4405 domain-containing protein [Candidatus Thiodiazotropha sp.]